MNERTTSPGAARSVERCAAAWRQRVARRGLASCAAVAAACAIDYGSPAAAAETEADEIGSIVVSARRRDESIQDAPVSITALSAEDLERRNVTDLTDLPSFAPNITFDRGSGNTGGSANAQVFMRGVGQQDWLFTIEPGVGVYVDGVYFARQMGNAMDLLDLERIEVLRGPQGTLFGKNTIGGAIQIITRKPGDKLGGYAAFTTGRFNRMDFTGAVNLPLSKNLAARLSFADMNRDGYVQRRLDDVDLGDIDSSGARLQLAWQPSESVDVLFAADYNIRREETVADVALAFNDNAPYLGLWNAYAGAGTYSSAFATGNPRSTKATGRSQSDLDVGGLSATVEWNAGGISVKSISAYRETDAAFAGDADNSSLPYLEQTNSTEIEQFSQELQLLGRNFDDRLDWILGLFYLREDAKDRFDAMLGRGLFAGLEALPGPVSPAPGSPGGPGNPVNVALDLDTIRHTSLLSEGWAAFAHASFDLTQRLSVSGGARYSSENKEFEVSYFKAGAQLMVVPPGTTAERTWSAFTPKLGLEYDFSDDVMSYVSASRGFKSGGFNGRPASLAVATRPFDPEYVWSYETGLKSTWFDRRLLVNAALFYSDYEDIQLTAVVASPVGGLLVVVDNAGSARVQGAELEIAARPVSGLDLNFGVGYIDAEYTSLNPGVTIVNLNSSFVKTPEWTFNAGAQYTFPVSSDGANLALRVDWAYRDRVENQPSNNPLLRQNGFGLLNARVTYQSAGDNWEIALFGENLTDELYKTNAIEALAVFGTADGVYGRPREWGATLKYSF